jgi:lysyl-tRNA synthetase class 2
MLGTVLRPVPFPLAAFFGLWTDSPTVAYAGTEGIWFHHSLHALAAAGVLYAVARMLRPLILATPATQDERQLARMLLALHGTDALCYFHMRRDRSYLFAPDRDGFISYVVRGDVALLGGDPVCSPPALRALVRHALDVFDANGLKVCVVGASAAAMHAWRAEGMRALKIGEEAIIDLRSFDAVRLAKRVRRAARSIAAHGIEMHVGAMAELDSSLVAQCHMVSREWLNAHGGVEQGFSMTSGPLPPTYDRDHQIVLGVLPAADGAPGRLLGFLTLAPVPARRGLSLDHMRRVDTAPNGLMESLIMHAAAHYRDAGYSMLSLNFAALCDRECPEGEGAAIRAARSTLFEGARHLPLLSLYRFNKKFEPRWTCRYLLYSSTASLPSVAYATVRAEVAAPALFPGRLGAALRVR